MEAPRVQVPTPEETWKEPAIQEAEPTAGATALSPRAHMLQEPPERVRSEGAVTAKKPPEPRSLSNTKYRFSILA